MFSKSSSHALSVLGGKNSKLNVVGCSSKISWMCMAASLPGIAYGASSWARTAFVDDDPSFSRNDGRRGSEDFRYAAFGAHARQLAQVAPRPLRHTHLSTVVDEPVAPV